MAVAPDPVPFIGQEHAIDQNTMDEHMDKIESRKIQLDKTELY